jgi:integrase
MASKHNVGLKTNGVDEIVPYDETRKLYTTGYKGVSFAWVQRKGSSQLQKSFVIRWMRVGKPHTEWVGNQYEDDMTAARANNLRSSYIEGTKICKAEMKKLDLQTKAKGEHGTFDYIYRHYVENYERIKEKKRKGKNSKNDDLRYKIYIAPKFGNRRPSSLSREELDDFKADLKETKKRRGKMHEYLSEATVWQILEIVRRLQNHARNEMRLDGFSFSWMPKKPDNKIRNLLKEEEFQRLVQACHRYPDKQTANAILTLLFSSARKNEVLNLKWDDVDFEYKRIYFRETKKGIPDNIPLPGSVKKILENHKKHHRVEGSEWIFTRPNGERLKEIWWGAKTIFKNAGLSPAFRIHDLRHTAITKLLQETDIPTVKEIARHKDIKTTLQYKDADEDAQREALDRYGANYLEGGGIENVSDTTSKSDIDYQI